MKIYERDRDLPDASKPPGISQEDWDELMRSARKHGDAGVKKHTKGDLSLEGSLNTWVHELGHSLFLDDELDLDSLMNTGAPSGTPLPRHYMLIAWLALACSQEDFDERLKVIAQSFAAGKGKKGQDDPLTGVEEVLRRSQGKGSHHGTPRDRFRDYWRFLRHNVQY